MDGSGVVTETGLNGEILVAIQITILIAQSEIWPLPNKLWADIDEMSQ